MSSATGAEDRRQAIVALLQHGGTVTVEQITERFRVSAMTARRDLDQLERGGLLVRRHGGAVVTRLCVRPAALREMPDVAAAGFAARARAVVGRFVAGQAVFLDGSPFAQAAAAELLTGTLRATVITNALSVIATLEQPQANGALVELVGIGGRFDRHERVFTGAVAVEQVGRHFADVAMLGGLGVSGPAGDVSRAMARHAAVVLDAAPAIQDSVTAS